MDVSEQRGRLDLPLDLLLSKIELTGTGFTSPFVNQNKPIQNLWNKGFQETWHQTINLWEIGNKWSESHNCLDLLPLQFLGMTQGQEAQAEPKRHP